MLKYYLVFRCFVSVYYEKHRKSHEHDFSNVPTWQNLLPEISQTSISQTKIFGRIIIVSRQYHRTKTHTVKPDLRTRTLSYKTTDVGEHFRRYKIHSKSINIMPTNKSFKLKYDSERSMVNWNSYCIIRVFVDIHVLSIVFFLFRHTTAIG